MGARPTEKARKQEGIISESKSKVRKVESDDDDSNFEGYNKSDGKLVQVDVDRKITECSGKDPTLTLLQNKSEEEEINNTGETGLVMIFGMVILVFGNRIENLNHRCGWVVYHISESKITYASLSMNNPKRAPETNK